MERSHVKKRSGSVKHMCLCVFSCILASIWNELPKHFQYFYHNEDSKASQ